jgi:DegV family protein with EDD domain
MFLHRGGRLSKLQAIAGSIIGIKPILNVSPDGTLKLKGKVRGRRAAMETLVSQMKNCLGPGTVLGTVLVVHADCTEDGEVLVGLVKESINVQNVMLSGMGPVISAHSGPGTLAIFFLADMTRKEYEDKFYGGKW